MSKPLHYTFTAMDNVEGVRATLETDLQALTDLIEMVIVPLLVGMGFSEKDVRDSMAEVADPALRIEPDEIES